MTQDQSLHDLISQAQNLLKNQDLDQQKKEVELLESQTMDPNFWQKQQASDHMRALATKKEKLRNTQKLQESLNDALIILELIDDKIKNDSTLQTLSQTQAQAQALNSTIDDSAQHDLSQELVIIKKNLISIIKKVKIEQHLSGRYDSYNALFSIHAGQGGTEAMDWANMLNRMYARFFERNNWKYDLIYESRAETGIKSIEYEVKANFAYGYLKPERGTHRLVRLSPFNADNLRQTSFALVNVLPSIEASSTQIIIPEADLSWKFTRSGGAGGQHVNKVSSAVELTYLPNGKVIKCREERDQIQNKQRALQKLKSHLASEEEQKVASELKKEKGEQTQASWGNQIRNYVLHPYQLVKDTRTGIETTDTTAVLDGDIEDFIQAGILL